MTTLEQTALPSIPLTVITKPLSDPVTSIGALPKSAILSKGSDYALNIVAVYQDGPTQSWAAQVCDQAIELVGEPAVQTTWWELNRFRDPEVLMDAALAAMQADAIVVSIYDAEPLPADLCRWIEVWLPLRRLPAGALIALIGTSSPAVPRFQPSCEYLRAIADKGRLDFLLRLHAAPFAPFVTNENVQSATRRMSVGWEASGANRNAYDHWGINE